MVLGLVTTKSGVLEDADVLKRRIDEAAKYVPLEQLCLSPQCGFSSTVEGNALTAEEQWAKLRLIVEVAADVWSEPARAQGRVAWTRGRGGRRRCTRRAGARGHRGAARPGCGAGEFARLAADRGCRRHRRRRRPGRRGRRGRRVPAGTFLVGDAVDPPPGPFDAVVALQLLAHVANPVAVLRAAPASVVVATVWGREEECDARVFAEALAPWLPPRPRGRARRRSPTRTGCGSRRVGRAGRRALDEVDCPFDHADEDALVGALLESGIGRRGEPGGPRGRPRGGAGPAADLRTPTAATGCTTCSRGGGPAA